MSDMYEIWLCPLQDWWKTVGEMLDFMYTGQMENFIFQPVRGRLPGLGWFSVGSTQEKDFTF